MKVGLFFFLAKGHGTKESTGLLYLHFYFLDYFTLLRGGKGKEQFYTRLDAFFLLHFQAPSQANIMFSIQTSALYGLLLYTKLQAANLPQQPLTQPSNMLSPLSSNFLGNSPLRYCNESRPTDLFWLDRIDVNPQQLYMYRPPRRYSQDPHSDTV